MKKYFIFFLSSVLALASCSKASSVVTDGPFEPNPDGSYNIEVTCDDLVTEDGMPLLATKGGSLLSEEYNKISSVGVLYFYQTSGQFAGAQYFEGSRLSIKFPDNNERYKVYIVGNISRAQFDAIDVDNINNCMLNFTEDSYKNFIVNGFPLGAYYENYKPGAETQLSVKRLTGFYRLSKISNINITKFQMHQLPVMVTPFKNSKDCTKFIDIDLDNASIAKLNASSTKEDGVIIYFLESMQGNLLPLNTIAENKLIKNVPPSKRPMCTYFTYTYTDAKGVSKTKEFCLGQNATYNFDIKRNTIIDIIIDDNKSFGGLPDDLYIYSDKENLHWYNAQDLLSLSDLKPGSVDKKYGKADCYIYDFRVVDTRTSGSLDGASYDVYVVSAKTKSSIYYTKSNSARGDLYWKDRDMWQQDQDHEYEYTNGTVNDERDWRADFNYSIDFGQYPYFGIEVKINGTSYWAELDNAIKLNGKSYIRLIKAERNQDCYFVNLLGEEPQIVTEATHLNLNPSEPPTPINGLRYKAPGSFYYTTLLPKGTYSDNKFGDWDYEMMLYKYYDIVDYKNNGDAIRIVDCDSECSLVYYRNNIPEPVSYTVSGYNYIHEDFYVAPWEDSFLYPGETLYRGTAEAYRMVTVNSPAEVAGTVIYGYMSYSSGFGHGAYPSTWLRIYTDHLGN